MLLHRPSMLTLLSVAGGLACPPPFTHASVVQPPPADGGRASQNLLASQMELPRLIDVAAERLKLNIEYDPAAVKGTVTLRISDTLSDEDLWKLVNQVLAARGLTTIKAQGPASYSVVKLSDAPGLAPVAQGKGADDLPAGFRSEVVRARNRPAKELVEQLTKVVSKPAGSVQPLGETGLIVVSDLSPRVEQAILLLETLDRAPVPMVIEEVPLTNLTAVQMVTLATQVNTKRDTMAGGGVSSSASSNAVPPAPPSASGSGGTGGGGGGGGGGGEIIAAPDGNAVILVSPEGRAAYWRDLIHQLDKRQRVEMVSYSSGAFAAKDLSKLIEQSVRTPGPAGIDDRFRIIADEPSGNLLVTATPAQHELISGLIKRLEGVPAASRRPARSYIIKNRPVREVQGILEQLLQAGVIEAGAENPAGGGISVGTQGGAGASAESAPGTATIQMPPPPAVSGVPVIPRGAGATTGAAPAPPARPRSGGSSPLVLTSDEATNTLMAVGEPRLLAQIEVLLKALDVRQAQVMLEVLMVTLTEGQTLDLGVELEKIEINGDLRARLSSLFGLGIRGSDGARDGPADALGFTGVVLSPGDFSVIIRALETINNGRSLSMPKLLVGNNQSASFDSVVQQPYASVNASNTVSTTSFGGSQDAGTVVTIKPQIAEGDHLLLEYNVSLSAFLGSAASPNLPPPKQQNRVQSVAAIPDGHTVVVGGIQVESKSTGTSQVPLLGNIPILGEAFKSRNNSSSRSTFYVFVRANILRARGFEDLKYLSERDVLATEVDDGWPKVEPSVIP